MLLSKVCTRCSLTKSVEDFPKNSKGKLGRGQKCKICSAEVSSIYRKQIPIKKAAQKYRVTEKEIEQVYYKTICDICNKPFKKDKRHAIDHDHATGQIRGLLCDLCNTGLGMFKDNQELLQKAIVYLQTNKLKLLSGEI